MRQLYTGTDDSAGEKQGLKPVDGRGVRLDQLQAGEMRDDLRYCYCDDMPKEESFVKITSFYSLPVLLFALQACNSGSPLGEGGYSPGEVDAQDPIEESGVPADWIEIAFFEYALRVPPDITRHRSIGIDSETQTYSSSQFSFLIFDGMIPLVTWDEDAPGLVEERLTLDSVETAVMATYGHPHDGYNIRLQIEDAGTIRPLRFRARCETEAQCQNIHKMLRTLRTLESTEPGPGHPPTTTFIDEVLP